MNEQLKQLIEALGGMSEICGIFRDGLLASGFTREEACALVGLFLSESLKTILPKE